MRELRLREAVESLGYHETWADRALLDCVRKMPKKR